LARSVPPARHGTITALSPEGGGALRSSDVTASGDGGALAEANASAVMTR